MISVDRPEDLPTTKIGVRSRSHPRRACPRCGPVVYRDRIDRHSPGSIDIGVVTDARNNAAELYSAGRDGR